MSVASQCPSIVFENGYKMPAVGLGTFQSKPGEVGAAVTEAIKAGYRHIDCAYIYANESEIGQAIQDCIQAGIVKREDLFITSKLWMTFMRPDRVRQGFNLSLSRLKLTYMDLFLVHWTIALKEGDEDLPKNEKGEFIFSDAYYVDTWKEMEKLVDEKLVRNIGISNFNHKQIENLLPHCRIKPAMNQIEAHPYFNNAKLIDFCHSHGILVTAYSPLGSPENMGLAKEAPRVLNDPVVVDLATKYKKTPGQILLRYALQRKIALVPKSRTPSRIRENFDIFDFELSSDDFQKLNSLNKVDGRIVAPKFWASHPHYAFNEEY